MKATKSAAKADRLAAKPAGVKAANGSGAKSLPRTAAGKFDHVRTDVAERRQRRKQKKHEKYLRRKERRLKGSDNDGDPTQARASRPPRLGLPKGELLPSPPSTYVGRLSTVCDWHRQVGKIYREMRRHQIDPGLGTRLTYVANVGATLARFIEESAPPGMDAPQDLSNLDDAELAQLEYLMAKAAGPQALERIEQAKPNSNWSGDDE
jgi:hypothetical protein